MEAQEPPEIAPDCWGKRLYLPSKISDGKRVWSFLLLNYSYKSWSIFKTKDSFVIYSSWAFQNCPWKLNLTKICRSNWAKEKIKLSFHQPFLKANIALYLSSLGQFLVVPELPYISTNIIWGNGSMSSMIWDIFGFCLHPSTSYRQAAALIVMKHATNL